MLTLIGTALRFLSFVFRIEFRLYLAKGYCEIISRKSDNLEQIKYLSLVLDSYNSYLRKNIKFEIKGIRRIKSKFIACVPNEKEKIIKSLCESLDSDKLGLARFIANTLAIPQEDLMVNEPLSQKLKVVGYVLATAVPIAIALAQLFIAPK
jgi:hypothetical protein